MRLALLPVLFTLAACSPAGTGTGGSGGDGGGTGGGAGGAGGGTVFTGSFCGTRGACDAGVCERPTNHCVECRSTLDCPSTKQYCNPTKQTCETTPSCTSDLDCTPSGRLCSASGGQTGLCIQCKASGDCAAGQACIGFSCAQVMSCTSSLNCTSVNQVCAPAAAPKFPAGVTNACQDCKDTADCATGAQCTQDNRCVPFVAPVCGPSTCQGCCATDGKCYAGAGSNTQCGAGGAACADCTSTAGSVCSGAGICTGPDLICEANGPQVSFATVYASVFVGICTNCHKPSSPDGSDTYGNYTTQTAAYGQVNKKSLYAGTEPSLKAVAPGSLPNSVMWLKVLGHAQSPSGKPIGGQMPLGAAALTASQKTLMKGWICTGANP